MTLSASGSVAIGTASPERRLHVNGSSSVVAALRMSTAPTNVAQFDFSDDDANRRYDIQVREGTGTWLNPMTFKTDTRNVGIGTTNPDERLTTGAQDKISFGYDAPPASGGNRRFKLWDGSGSGTNSCNTICGNAYCLGGYLDNGVTKITCADTQSANKECICIGKP